MLAGSGRDQAVAVLLHAQDKVCLWPGRGDDTGGRSKRHRHAGRKSILRCAGLASQSVRVSSRVLTWLLQMKKGRVNRGAGSARVKLLVWQSWAAVQATAHQQSDRGH